MGHVSGTQLTCHRVSLTVHISCVFISAVVDSLQTIVQMQALQGPP